jgi:hypothetical protein
MNYILNKGIQMEVLEDGIIIFNEETENVIYLGENEKKLFEMLLKKDFVSVVNELKSMYEKEAPIEEDLRDFCRDLEKEGIISKNNDDSLCEN